MLEVANTKATMFCLLTLIHMKDAKGDGFLEVNLQQPTKPSATSNAVPAIKLGCPPTRRSSSSKPAKAVTHMFCQPISG